MSPNHPLLRVALALSLLVALATAQKPVIGYFEFKDERSGAVGLRKHFLDHQGVEARFFDIAKPGSFKPHEYDVIMIGSFSEFHPAWNDFVRREKENLLKQVDRGAMLIVFNRHRRNSDKLSLLPSGYSVKRSNKDFRRIYFHDVKHPMWKGMTQRPSRGWHMLEGGKIGRKDQPAFLDAFEEWSRNFKKSAGPEKQGRGGWAAVLSAKYGRGEIMLLQLTYDKLEEATGRRSRAAAREFFKAMIVYIGRRPKFQKPRPPVAGGGPGRTPPPRNDPPVKEPEPIPVPTPKTTVLVRARVFEDLDGDGNYDVGEPALSDVRVIDGTMSSRTGSSGLAMTEVSRRTDRVLRIDVPDGFDATTGWYVEVPFTTLGDLDAVDVLFPLSRLGAAEGRRVLFARLDRLEEGGAAERIVADLGDVFAAEAADAAILLIDAGAAERGSGRMLRLRERLDASGLPVRVVTASGTRTRGDQFGPADGSFVSGGATFVTTASAEALTRLARRGPERDTVVILAGSASTSSVAELIRAGARAVVATAGPTGVDALTLAPRLSAKDYGVLDVVDGAVTLRIGPEVVTDANPVTGGEVPDPPVDVAPSLPLRESHPHVRGSLEAALKDALGGESSQVTPPPGVEEPVNAPAALPVGAMLTAAAVVAHRGGAAEGPENTLTAVENALATGCGAIEIDVRLTGDGKLVLFHDATIGSRNGDLTGKSVNTVPYFELRKVDVGADGMRESPPLLDDVLTLDWSASRLVIDARPDGDAAALGEACAKVVGAWEGKARVDFSSADPDALRAFNSVAADVPLAAMIEKAADVPRFDGLPVKIWMVKSTALDASVAAFLAKGRREVRVGIVDDPARAKELLAIPGVTAVVTDAPARLLGK